MNHATGERPDRPLDSEDPAAPWRQQMGKRRALIVSTARDRGALAAARALNQSGWTVGVGMPDAPGMLGSSRACTARHPVPRPRGDGIAFVDGVRKAVTAGAYDVVFGGGDDWMAALSTYRNDIPARVAHPRSGVVEAALDKVNLAEAAFDAGLAAPYTATATEQALAGWAGPVVVKCRAHWSQGQTRPHRIEAKLFPHIEAARKQVEHLRKAGAEPVLQTPVRGSLGALIGVFHDGRLNGRVQQVSSRLWPTPNGASARAETIPVDEGLAAKAETLLRRLNWSGLVELQFLTGADGVPHLIDLNGRFFGSLALSNVARPGLIDAWGQLVLDGSMPDLEDARTGVRYAWTAGDLRRAGVERRNGVAADVIDTLRWARKAEHSVWRLSDPGPAWNLAAGRFTRSGGKAGKPVPRPAES
ncbi:ATP-grasp domain-containing protein [Arthrobacter sp. H14]|uniref:ATP-grasp domain-containing protein n=1 Tax=Arthrobacter sp. H14 TaxID=1312959 RepID=UPI0004AF99E3|nr:ATP-grasp domain-containing protein [Arthrobacter sp. H14]